MHICFFMFHLKCAPTCCDEPGQALFKEILVNQNEEGEFDCMLEKPYFKYLGFGGRKAWGELEKYKKGVIRVTGRRIE